MWTDRFEKRERFPGSPKAGYEYLVGDRGRWYVSVDPSATSFDEPDIWDIHLHVAGASTIQAIRGLDKALRIALYLYDELLPEAQAERERSEERYQESERQRWARHEAERPERERAAREREKLLAETEPEEAAKCPECGHVDHSDEFDVPVYECSRCGSTGRGEEGRRCDQCHIFRFKVASKSCPVCEAPTDDEEMAVQAKHINNEYVEVTQ